MCCKYCEIDTEEVLMVDEYGNEYHDSCEEEFECTFKAWLESYEEDYLAFGECA